MNTTPSGGEPHTDDELRMTFLSHLEELRTRIIRSMVVVVAAALGAYAYGQQLMQLILPPEGNIIALSPAEHFFPYIELSIVVGILVTFPFLVYQVWGFVAPGLYRRERRYAAPIIVAASGCFYLGVAFCYFVIIPLLLTWLPKFSGTQILSSYSAREFLHFYVKLLLVFGISFNTPVVVTLLALLDVISYRTIARARPYVVVGMFGAAALLTPPDVISQLLLGGPLWLLFEVGLFIAWIIEIKRARKSAGDENA